MFHRTIIKLVFFVITVFSIFTMSISFAQETIYATSIAWDDETGRSQLLESVPRWNDDVIKSLFQAYLHPDRYALPSSSNPQHHNVQFINALWGPLENPFNKHPRPAKAFIIFDKYSHENDANTLSSETFHMAPLVQNLADGNYYIFDKSQTQPLLLNDWIANKRNSHGVQRPVRFNICNGYGNSPTDSCMSKGYRAEADEISNSMTFHLNAKNPIVSAHRDSSEDWKIKARNAKKMFLHGDDSIFASSIFWKDEAIRNKLLNTVVAWPNYKSIQNNFEKIRDIRYFNDPQYPDFQRRISWLYPDDGCWTRATAVIRDLFGPLNNLNNEYPRPSKVFAFGNLCANTSNSSNGRVTWWYHTAPIVKDAETNQTYVLDPSINPYKPITMEKWVEEISSNAGACAKTSSSLSKFNICNGYGTSPHDECKSIYQSETESMLMQSEYQKYERRRQETLGRNANDVLGTLPPWLN